MKFIDRSTLAPRSLTETRMVSSVPPELLDLIVDHLRDEPIALKACCLISKSWLHRIRSHIFADVRFDRPSASTPHRITDADLPDPSNSPAHYARISRFVISNQSLLQSRTRVPGFTLSVTSYTWEWTPMGCGSILTSPWSRCSDYHPLSNPFTCVVITSHSQ